MKSLPKRTDVREHDTWDLRSLFASDAEWDVALLEWEKRIPLFRDYVGTLSESADKLAQCLIFDLEIAFLVPWAIVLEDIGLFGLISMGIFLGVLVIGFIYEWKKGALEWE